MDFVLVLSSDGKSLMPTTPARARKKLKNGLAKVIRKCPFTIKLLYETTSYVQSVTVGVDVGTRHVGMAVVDVKGRVFYACQLDLRTDIVRIMTDRRTYRKNRRYRKTRYRKTRFSNRASLRRKERIPPSVGSKVNSITNSLRELQKYFPSTKVVLEIGVFDPNFLDNPDFAIPEIGRWGYQHGIQYGFQNVRAAVLARDRFRCYVCKKEIGKVRLQIHHIIFRKEGGSNRPDNLLTLCEECHKRLHKGEISIKPRNLNRIADSTQMNTISSQLLKLFPDAETTFGYITSENRRRLGYDKTEHWLDAVVIATGGIPFVMPSHVYYGKCFPEGDYRRTKGNRSEILLPKGKIYGFKRYDKVRYLGKEYILIGRRSVGTGELEDIHGNRPDFSYMPHGKKTPKLSNMARISARRSRMFFMEKVTPDMYSIKAGSKKENEDLRTHVRVP